MASRQNLLQCAVCVITSKITKVIIMFYCVIVRFKQKNSFQAKLMIMSSKLMSVGGKYVIVMTFQHTSHVNKDGDGCLNNN